LIVISTYISKIEKFLIKMAKYFEKMLTVLFEFFHLSLGKRTFVDFLHGRMLMTESINIPFGGVPTVTNASFYELPIIIMTNMLLRIETFQAEH
jgi:hypothetical protein